MKKVLPSLALLLVFSFKCHAQNEKLSYGLNFFPNLSYGLVTNVNNDTASMIASYIRDQETWRPSYSLSFFSEYKINKTMSVGLGLGYQNNGSRDKKVNFNNNCTIDPRQGFICSEPGDENIEATRSVYNFHNIEVNLYLKRQFFESRYYILAGSSLISNISNTSTQVLYYNDNSKTRNTEKDDITDFRKLNVSVNLGFGMNYFSNEKLTLYLQPNAQYTLLGVIQSSSPNRTILSLGISTGVKF